MRSEPGVLDSGDAEPGDGDRPLTVLIVDGQPVSRLGFRLLLGRQPWVERCLSTDHGNRAIELAVHYGAHVALVDTAVDGGRGVALARRLRARVPHLHSMLVGDGAHIDASIARFAGADGVLSRTLPAEDLLASVRGAANGGLAPRLEEAAGVLSARERDVMRLIAAGATNPQVATELLLSPNTVKQHASSAYRKLEARNRADAVRRAQEIGLL